MPRGQLRVRPRPGRRSSRTSSSTAVSSAAFACSSSGSRRPLAVQLEDECAQVQQQRLANPLLASSAGAAEALDGRRPPIMRIRVAAPRRPTIAPRPANQPSRASATTRRSRRSAAHRELAEDPLARAARCASGPSSSARRTPSRHRRGLLGADQHAGVAHHLRHRRHVHDHGTQPASIASATARPKPSCRDACT